MRDELELVRSQIENGEAILVDVREQSEWDTEHLSGAVLLPLSEIEDGDYPNNLPQDKTLYLYCRRGIRAQVAATLMRNDFPKVHPLPYHFTDIKTAKFDTTQGKK